MRERKYDSPVTEGGEARMGAVEESREVTEGAARGVSTATGAIEGTSAVCVLRPSGNRVVVRDA